MKFESAFGIGEIVCTKQTITPSRIFNDSMFRIVAVTFEEGGTNYLARSERGQMIAFMESELIGDPDFNQETGRYPDGVLGTGK